MFKTWSLHCELTAKCIATISMVLHSAFFHFLCLIPVLFILIHSCPGGRNSSKPCPEGFYNNNTGQSDIGACQVILAGDLSLVYMPNHWIVFFFVCSDWLLKLATVFAIHPLALSLI